MGKKFKRSKYEEGGTAPNQNASTPHQKKLSGKIGVQKALGMGKVGKIGITNVSKCKE